MTEEAVAESKPKAKFGAQYLRQTIGYEAKDGRVFTLNSVIKYEITPDGTISEKRVVTAISEDGKRLRFIAPDEYILTAHRRSRENIIGRAERDGIPRDLTERVLQFLNEKPETREPQLMLRFD